MASPARKPAGNRTIDYEFTNRDFDRLRKLIGDYAGISLADSKRDLVYGRLCKRLRAHGMQRFSDYIRMLDGSNEGELELFVNALTTNLTSFFRERHHFEYLREAVLPDLVRKLRNGSRVRIWSAGCSTGEEPYSLAITLLEAVPEIARRDIRILATDLDTDVVSRAAAGIYPDSRTDGLDGAVLRRWFEQGSGNHAGYVRASDELRNLITFRQLNLMEAWPMTGLFDVVFCRNVVIYFDKSTQSVLFDRYANIMQPDSHLFIGHSETLHKVSERFELIGKTVYRKMS